MQIWLLHLTIALGELLGHMSWLCGVQQPVCGLTGMCVFAVHHVGWLGWHEHACLEGGGGEGGDMCGIPSE